MRYTKKFKNGLRLVIDKIDGLFSVSAGVLVKTGSVNETEKENGISHYIEHALFKGTTNRSAFEISDYIDRIGAQINAFTSKEMTCYYTKSTSEHLNECLDVLSDLFFNATFDPNEMQKEKGVIIEEINMSEDTPEDVCLDILASAYHGDEGLGRTILGTKENIVSFTKEDVDAYMDKYYTADNVVISLAGNVDVEDAIKTVQNLFADKFTRLKSKPQIKTKSQNYKNVYKNKKIEQTHIALCMPAIKMDSEKADALNIANVVFGGGMSSRLFQTIREELGLAYSVYSYLSLYKDRGVLEIYAGVSTDKRDKAVKAILNEIQKIIDGGVTEQEFLRGKEQIKSAFIMGRESTSSQMLLNGRYMLFRDEELDFTERMKKIDAVTLEDVNKVIKEIFTVKNLSSATVGPKKSALRIK
ncbi:MAG: insulinase family protein [Clostridia bacterium]|nr:insulinase family protein [Clostridia bacterium]